VVNWGSMSRARAVLITGVPGSGKSTLARRLSHLLRIPYLARDDVRGGLFFTEGAWSDVLERVPSAEEAVDVFLATAEQLLTRGVSCVLEYVVRGHRPGDLDRITAVADCVVVTTACADPTARLRDRNGADRLIANPAVLRAAGLASVAEHTDMAVRRMAAVAQEMRTDFPLPTLQVDTTHGYRPDIEAILAFVTGASTTGRAPTRAARSEA
jgi:predicted kinase